MIFSVVETTDLDKTGDNIFGSLDNAEEVSKRKRRRKFARMIKKGNLVRRRDNLEKIEGTYSFILSNSSHQYYPNVIKYTKLHSY